LQRVQLTLLYARHHVGAGRSLCHRRRKPALRDVDRCGHYPEKCPGRRQDQLLMTTTIRRLVLLAAAGTAALAQTEPQYLEGILKDEIISPAIARFQLRQYILN